VESHSLVLAFRHLNTTPADFEMALIVISPMAVQFSNEIHH